MTGGSLPTHPRSPTSSESRQPEEFVLTLWTDDPVLAGRADGAGIQRVGLDLETLGKLERQHGLGTWISPHRIDRLPVVRASLKRAQLFARVNPLHRGSREEVDRLLELGVRVLMLPMFESAAELARFCAIVADRATVVALLETSRAAEKIAEIVLIPGLEEIHIGINDLAISIGAHNRFEILQSPVVEHVSATVRAAGLRFGIGAIGRLDDHGLPITADLVYARYVQLGASAALLARAYAAGSSTAAELADAIALSRRRLAWWSSASEEQHRRAGTELRRAIARCASW